MNISKLEHLEGMSMICPIAATFLISKPSSAQRKMEFLYFNDDDDNNTEDFPVIEKVISCEVGINVNDHPEMTLNFIDTNNNEQTFYATYIPEKLGLVGSFAFELDETNGDENHD